MAKPQVKDHFAKKKRPKKEKAKKPDIKLAAAGHNSGEPIPELVEIVDEILASAARVKEEGKLTRDLRNRAKSEFGVLSSVLAHEIRLRKMNGDVRVQFESSHQDLKVALGYQHSMDLKPETVARTEEEYVDPGNRTTAEVIQREG